MSGGYWDGQLAVSYTQEIQPEKSQSRSSFAQSQSSQSHTMAQIQGHTSTCTAIASTIDDPNKIISKAQQNQSQSGLQNEGCTVITGAKSGDVIVWRFVPDQNQVSFNVLTKAKHFYDHDDQVSSIFIHQEMQYFATSSHDGSCNLYNLLNHEILRCFKHSALHAVSTVVISN